MDEKQDKFVNIEIRAEGQNAITKTELPLKVLVLGDFTPENPKIENWETPSRLIDINTRNFQSVMEQLMPCLSFSVTNRLSDNPKELAVELKFPNIQAFRPDEVARQVEELANLLEIRQLVSQLKDGKITLQEFDERFQQTGMAPAWLEQFHQLLSKPAAPAVESGPQKTVPVEPVPPKGDVLDSLLSMVDTGSERTDAKEAPGSQPTEVSHVDSLIRAITGSKKVSPKADKSIIEMVINELDEMLSGQVNDILHHRKFQQLESAWRGLKFLIDRTDFRENIKIEIICAHKDELRNAVYHQVFTPEYNEVSETPLSVMIADFEFDQSAEDMELLKDIAQIAYSINAPFIASTGPAFFGLQAAADLAKLPVLDAYFQKPEYNQWNALRNDGASQCASLTASRFLLRFPYGPESIPAKGFNFVERIQSSTDYLWGSGVFAIGAAIVRSFAECGWCVRITGLRGGGLVENLPVRPYRVAGRDITIPLEALFNQSKEKDFMDSGFTILSSRINDDKACIMGAPTIYRPQKYTTAEENIEARLLATLPYQLFATRMAHYLRRITKEISTGLTAEHIQSSFITKLRSILTIPGVALPPDAVMVSVSDSKENPGYYDVSLRIKPPFQILGQDADLMLGMQLRH